MTLDATQIELIRKIKGVFDPNNILNPGKIVDIIIDKGKDRNYNE
jgi:glycolate oxidase